MKRFLSLSSILFLILSISAQEAEQYFKPLKYRNIGPFRGGRSVSASGVVGDQLTYYMGTTGGGLWKTEDAGQRWQNISDGYFKTGSVGAVAVSESNPNIIYVGMGEHAVRGVMTSHGDGVYKSTDAGKTWTHLGLEKTQHVSRIIIHPDNPDIVLVAAQGALYGPTKERGIYKSVDGGVNWKKVLYVNDLTGGVELSMDMNYPEVIYAAMWHHQRKPWVVVSGGEGSGLYKSTDGGETWRTIHNGLPKEKGKMAIAVCRSNSNKVYALIESDSNKDLGGLFVSNNAGNSWRRVSDDNRLTQRAWYYIEVFTDPNNENVVYVLSAPALRSIDGGKTWERITGTHGDYHDLWINPQNSKNMVIANDGGAAISFNYGNTWSTQSNMPTAQFYRINADNLFPYNIYGGQQDNTSVRTASLSTGRWSITEQDWTYSAGGESAFLAFDPDDPNMVLGGSYLGTIQALDMTAKASSKIMAAPIQYLGRAARDMKYLYNWNAPIIWSQHNKNTFYHCAQMVLRTEDFGLTWEEISPDLTRNIDDKQGKGGEPYTVEAVGAENYGTIAYMVESPHEKGVFYTGSDDGLVHISKDNGMSWQNITPKGLKECLINAIDISPHDPATAYIATTRYKFNDHTPGIYKTTDYGKTWTNISTGIPYGAFTRVLREDDRKKGLLYAGTETGIFISWNGGKNWEPFQLNLPVTPITDLKVHMGDLIVATSGRSFWILDDLSVLGQYEPKQGKIKLCEPEPAVHGFWGSPLNGNNPAFKGSSDFSGINPANGLVIYYELPETKPADIISLEIRNEAGALVNSFSSKRDSTYRRWDGGPPPTAVLSKNKGLNRFVWDMRHPIMSGVPDTYIEANFRGHVSIPGRYSLSLKMGDEIVSSNAEIIPNPQYKTRAEQYEEYDKFMLEMEREVTVMHDMVNQIYKAKNQLNSIVKALEAKKGDRELIDKGKELLKQMKLWDEDMIQRKSKAYDDVENFPNKFTAEYLFLINQTESSIPRVNKSSRDRKAELDTQWKNLKSKGKEFINSEIPSMNQALWAAGIGAIKLD
ncbi:MAG: glycosyl hydrolase [Bacteroidia bacterium]|nr:glycosyl hydrolase [Bacteroidia bacterium]